MGVTDLWPILEPASKECTLSDLKGKRLSIDLSGWIVASKQQNGLNKTKKPHLRTLFFRTSCLLKNGIIPIFITEGKVPELKIRTIKDRNILQFHKQHKKNYDGGTGCRSGFEYIVKECEELLQSMGIPFLKSSGEAESYCAFLNSEEIVDGCITDDSDAFLYGAEIVYRDFGVTTETKEYSMTQIKQNLQLDRRKMIALSLLLGCDYDKGVKGIGKETALNLLTELKDVDILERFSLWKRLEESELFPNYSSVLEQTNVSHCSRCKHFGKQVSHKREGCSMCNSDVTCYLQKEDNCICDWHRNKQAKEQFKNEIKIYNSVKGIDDFPNTAVIDEYLNNSNTVPCEESLQWTAPDVSRFQENAFEWFGWEPSKSMEKILPLCTAWQINQRCKSAVVTSMDFVPVRIMKVRKEKGVKYFQVLWRNKDDEDMDEAIGSPDSDMSTLEDQNDLQKAYPELVEEYFKAVQAEKDAAQAARKKVSRKDRKISSPKKGKSVDNPSQKLKVLSSDPEPTYILSNKLYSTLHISSASNNANLYVMPFDTNNKENDFSFFDMPLSQRLNMAKTYVSNLVKSPCVPQSEISNTSMSIYQDCKSNTTPECNSVARNLSLKLIFESDNDLSLHSCPNISLKRINCSFSGSLNSPSVDIQATSNNLVTFSPQLDINNSDDSFLDIPLSERAHFREISINVPVKDLNNLKMVQKLSVLSPVLPQTPILKTRNCFLLSSRKCGMPIHGTPKITEKSYFKSMSVTKNKDTSLQRLLYSVNKSKSPICPINTATSPMYNAVKIAYTSTPETNIDNSNVHSISADVSFINLLMSEEEYDASEELFPSSSKHDSSSVICLN